MVVDRTFKPGQRDGIKKTLPLRAQINSKGLWQTVFDLVSILHEALLEIS